jgi:hypothetical protein
MRAVPIILLLSTISVARATPCDGIDRGLTAERSAALARAIAEELHTKTVDVLQSYSNDSWSILYIDTHEADRAFLFFSGNPLKDHHYVTLWSGAARQDEEQDIMSWALKNAPGIPPPLARCFAWHVTKDRDL